MSSLVGCTTPLGTQWPQQGITPGNAYIIQQYDAAGLVQSSPALGRGYLEAFDSGDSCCATLRESGVLGPYSRRGSIAETFVEIFFAGTRERPWARAGDQKDWRCLHRRTASNCPCDEHPSFFSFRHCVPRFLFLSNFVSAAAPFWAFCVPLWLGEICGRSHLEAGVLVEIIVSAIAARRIPGRRVRQPPKGRSCNAGSSMRLSSRRFASATPCHASSYLPAPRSKRRWFCSRAASLSWATPSKMPREPGGRQCPVGGGPVAECASSCVLPEVAAFAGSLRSAHRSRRCNRTVPGLGDPGRGDRPWDSCRTAGGGCTAPKCRTEAGVIGAANFLLGVAAGWFFEPA